MENIFKNAYRDKFYTCYYALILKNKCKDVILKKRKTYKKYFSSSCFKKTYYHFNIIYTL